MANCGAIPKSLMKKFPYRGFVNALAILLMILAPALLAAQRSLIPRHQGGPLAASDDLSANDSSVNDPSAAELPASPDATVTPAARQPLIGSMFAVQAPSRREAERHRFWDRENSTLFAASAAWAGADFYVTHKNLAAGGRELNPVARVFAGSTPALAANFTLETVGVVGISYFFHKTGHHKLERATSYVNISASAGAVLYGLTHR